MKKHDFTTKKERFCFREVGRELLKIEIKSADIVANDEKDCEVGRVLEFCQEIVNNCKKYAESTLFDIIKTEYKKALETGAGRDFKKYLYRIACDVSDEEECVLVEFEAALLRSGRVLHHKRIRRRWDVKRALMIPNYNRKKKDEKEQK